MTYRDEPKDGDRNVNGEAVPVQTQLNRKIKHPYIKYFWWVHNRGFICSLRVLTPLQSTRSTGILLGTFRKPMKEI
jgi:hypothetical protein